MFGRLRKSNGASRAPRPPESVAILLKIESGDEIYWRVSPEGVERMSDEAEVQSAVSFTREDMWLPSEPVSNEKAKSSAVRSSGSPEKLRVINGSKLLGSIYATPAERISRLPAPVSPGPMVLDALLREHKITAPAITGFFLHKEGGESVSILILYALHESGRFDLSISLNPADPESAVSGFSRQHKLQDGHTVALFSLQEFLGAVHATHAYPSEVDWKGIPVSRIAAASLIASIASVTGAWGYMLAGSAATQSAKTERERLIRQTDSDKSVVGDLALRKPVEFARSVSIDPRGMLGFAEALWRPGAKITIEAVPGKYQYTLIFPFVLDGGSTRNQLAVAETAAMKVVLGLVPPEHCMRDNLLVNGQINELHLAVTCIVAAPKTNEIVSEPAK